MKSLLVGAVLGIALVGCSAAPPAVEREPEMKLFVSVAPVGTCAHTVTAFVSGPATSYEAADRDAGSSILQTPGAILPLGETAVLYVGENLGHALEGSGAVLESGPTRGEIHEVVQYRNGFLVQEKVTEAAAGKLRVQLRAYILKDGFIEYRGVHDLVIAPGELRVVPLERASG